jgi:peptidoglycan hydrolase-like protein with peptidoglycan-binding domain
MTTLTVMAGSNVLYHQQHRHPAPLFSQTASAQIAELQEVEPVPPPARRAAAPVQQVRPQVVPEPVVTSETTGSLSGDMDSDGPVGNAKVYEVQKKLQEMQLFSGKVDGYYGPMTADAIRKFEADSGRTPEGALTPDVVDAILAAPVGGPSAMVVEPQREPVEWQPAPRPENVYVAPAVAQQEMPAPIETPVTQQAEVPPLVFSQPAQQRQAQVQQPQQQQVYRAPAQQQAPVLIARQVESGPEAIFDEVADGAADVFDSLAQGVQDLVQQPQSSVRQVPKPVQTRTPPASMATASVTPAAVRATPLASQKETASDPQLVSKVQRGLASLGFLAGAVDGVPGEATAKAIRNFEVYYNYPVTGKVTPQLVGMLENAGAVI